MIDVNSILQENEYRKAEKAKEYDPISGLNCCGERFAIIVPEKKPYTFYLPIEMKDLKAIKLLQTYGSITEVLKNETKSRKPKEDEIDFFWYKICEERYKYDFEFYAVSCCWIIDKETANYIRFKPNPAQRMLIRALEKQRLEGRQINIIILKAKQMGFTTLIQMYMQWIQIVLKKNWNSAICAHELTAAINIRSMYDNSIRMMPPVGGEKKTICSFGGTTNIKQIPERGCRITVGTAQNPESIRSQDLKMIHLSEMAFYPETIGNNPELLESSMISSLTDGQNTMVIRESTANGVGNYFYNQWQKAKRGETAYEPIFAPWFMIDLYSEPFEDNKFYLHNGKKKKGTVADFILTLNDYERNLWNNYKLCTLENLNWRRMKASTMPNESKMRQEYPSDDIEAFQDSGNPVFKAEEIEALRKDCKPPQVVGVLSSKCSPALAITDPQRRSEILMDLSFVPDKEATNAVLYGTEKDRIKKGENKLHVWVMPDTSIKVKNRYVVSFDPQKGLSDSADYGVIKVFDRYWMMHGEGVEVVALFYGHIDKDITIWIAAQIAKWYNNALLVVESNTYDSDIKEDDTEFIFETIKQYYGNLYSRTPTDKIQEGVPVKYGFNTNRKTKPTLIETFTAVVREKGYTERDHETLNEARVFEYKPDGSTGAKGSNHDDRLMATMIGIYVCYKLPLPSLVVPKEIISTKKIVW
jgi:hypothetical protein